MKKKHTLNRNEKFYRFQIKIYLEGTCLFDSTKHLIDGTLSAEGCR